ncbi:MULTISPECIES: TRAP transporter substrate-binding protein DctP [Brevibacterium]|uniref:TRAP transporter substrate-binding protein DctP n=1 Tax=Brevibacterium salitolerans TaxID=1403566 RepID=A0ABN2WX50_9MICO|nr:TRAP transporter substrate-binding protein DctP [Brevibacterium sp.]
MPENDGVPPRRRGPGGPSSTHGPGRRACVRRPARAALAGAAAAVAVLSGCAGSGPGAAPLTLADSYATTHMFARYGVEGFLEDVAAQGPGETEIDYFPSGQLGGPRDIADLTQAGAIDIAPAAPAYLSDQLPLSSVTDLPGLAEDSCTASAAFWDLLDEDGILYREEYEPRGLRPLWVAVIPSYEIMTVSTPVRKPADLDGLTIRSSGGAMDTNVEGLGGAPVSMPAADAYEALSRHTVDGISFPYASVTPYRLEEVLGYSTKGLNAGSFAIPYVIAEDAWQQLPAEQQERIRTAGEQASDRLCAGIEEENPASEQLMRDAGVEFTELTPEEQEEFAARLDPLRAEWADAMDAAGRPGTEVLTAYESAVQAHSADADTPADERSGEK